MNPALIFPSFTLPSLVAHLNLTGLNVFKKLSPVGRSTISVLSLLSDKELIEVSLHLRLEILELPKVISLDVVAELGSAVFPKIILLVP